MASTTRVFRVLIKAVLVLLALLILAGIGLFASDPRFWKRVATSMQSLDVAAVDWRQPQEPVRGGNRRPVDHRVDGIAPEALHAAIDYAERMDSHALLIQHRGALVLERYWNEFGPDSRFDTASMHKTVLAMLLGLAIKDGHIASLDDPVSRYIREWADDARGAITLRQLATMSSGLKVEAFRPSPFSRGMRLVLGTDIESLALDLPTEGPPGEDFQYMNFNSQILGIALSRAVGQRYADYLSARLWQPLGAPDAAVWLDREDGKARTFCCLLASAPAWLQVGAVLLNDGQINGDRILPANWVAEMTTGSATNPNYGLQLWLGSPADGIRRYNRFSGLEAEHSEPYLAPDVMFLDGVGGQRVYVIPSAELVIVRVGEPAMDWDDAVLPNTLLRGLVHEAGY